MYEIAMKVRATRVPDKEDTRDLEQSSIYTNYTSVCIPPTSCALASTAATNFLHCSPESHIFVSLKFTNSIGLH